MSNRIKKILIVVLIAVAIVLIAYQINRKQQEIPSSEPVAVESDDPRYEMYHVSDKEDVVFLDDSGMPTALSQGQGTEYLDDKTFYVEDYDSDYDASHAATLYGETSAGKFYIEQIRNSDLKVVAYRCHIIKTED